MELWGYCRSCDRWFFMEALDAVCPVCVSAPEHVHDRTPPQRAEEVG